MVREIIGNFVLNVRTEDGHFYKDCDVPLNFVNENATILTFWFEDKLKAYPMRKVDFFEIVEKEA